MQDKVPIRRSGTQKSTRQDKLEVPLRSEIQFTVEYVGKLISELIDQLKFRGCYLRLEVKRLADGWVLVLSFEMR